MSTSPSDSARPLSAPPRGPTEGLRARLVAGGLPLAIALAVGLLLRLVRIGAREPWLDEACTGLFAEAPGPGALLALLLPESHPPLYYLLMQGFVRVFGSGAVALRVPSLVAGLALVGLAYRAARVFGGGRLAAGLAAGLAATSPWLVYYSVEAKAYTLLFALGLGLVLALRRAAEPGGGRAFVAAGVLTTLALYTHHFALFLVPLWGLAVAAAPRAARWRGAAALGAALALWAPWGALVLGGQIESGGTSWLAEHWHGVGPALAGTARAYALAPPFPRYLGELGLVALPVGAALALGAWFGVPAVLGTARALVPVVAPERSRGPRLLAQAILPAAALVPVLAAALVSLWRPMYLVGRYDLLGYGPFVVLWALGLEAAVGGVVRARLRTTLAALVGLLSLVGVGAVTGPYVARPPAPWSYREAARALAAAPPADLVVAVGLTRAPLELQLRQAENRNDLVSFPPDVARHPGWFVASAYDGATLAAAAERLARLTLDRPGVWLVVPLDAQGGLAEPPISEPLFRALRAVGRQPGRPLVFGTVGVTRLAR